MRMAWLSFLRAKAVAYGKRGKRGILGAALEVVNPPPFFFLSGTQCRELKEIQKPYNRKHMWFYFGPSSFLIASAVNKAARRSWPVPTSSLLPLHSSDRPHQGLILLPEP
jgi:hypothetical protein